MKNMLALIGLLVVGFAGVGWYCGWYQLSVSKGTEGRPEIKTTVNTDKVADDSAAFFKKMGQLVSEKVKEAEQKAAQPASAPGTTPGPVAPVKTDGPQPVSRDGWFLPPAAPVPPRK